MRIPLCICLCFLIISEIHAILQKARPCYKQTDCNKSQCCQSRHQFRGKRDLTTSSPGICTPRPQGGQSCIAEFTVPLPTDGTFRRCPCAAGLECQANGLIDIPTGKMGTCVRKITPRPCNNASDCRRYECCVSRVRPIGKRDTERKYIGTCQNLGQRDDNCLVRNNEPSKGARFASCPCRKRLTCVPDGGIDIPLGPTGTCQNRQYSKY